MDVMDVWFGVAERKEGWLVPYQELQVCRTIGVFSLFLPQPN